MKLTWQEGRLAPHPQASEETPAGGDKFSVVQPSNSSVAKVLWPVAQAVPSEKDTQFPADANTTGARTADTLESGSNAANQPK